MLSLSAVSADESVGGMDTLAIDDGASCSVDNVQLQSFSDQQTVDDGGENEQPSTYSGTNYTFAELDEMIQSSPDGTIKLQGNVVKQENEFDTFVDGIIIDHDLTINGNGYSIDANHNGSVFEVVGVNVTLTITNITFTNANTTHYGGVIYSSSDNSNIIIVGNNVKFINNNAVKYGGAIYTYDGGVSVSGSNITFADNSAYHGGAIYSKGDVTVFGDYITFIGNNAVPFGGAIYTYDGGVSVSGSNITFADNSAHTGGAIYTYDGGVSVSGFNITFAGNIAHYLGGAIQSTASVCVSGFNITFAGNIAESENGGAIYNYDGGVNISGDYITFTSNNALNGGAIFSGSEVAVSGDYITFLSNTADNGAGVIFADNNIDINGSNVVFENNKGTSAIHSFFSSVNVVNTIFINNAIISVGDSSNLNGNYWGGDNPNSLVDGVATVDDWIIPVIDGPDVLIDGEEYGYFISLVNSSNGVSIDDSRLASIKVQLSTNNSTKEVILDEGSVVVSYTANIGDNKISIIDDVTGNELSFLTINIIPNNTFTALNWTINGNDEDIIALEHDYYYNVDYDSALVNGIVINRNLTINGNGFTVNGSNLARIFQITGDNIVLTLNNITLSNANATDYYGGAIYASGDVTVSGSNIIFTGNTADYGGAIYASGDVTVSGDYITFINNTAYWGGAILVDLGDVTVSGDYITFINNNAEYGGAISFPENTAIRGCVIINSGTVSFVNNIALCGGAIYSYGYVDIIGDNIQFVNNNASQHGGAIYSSDCVGIIGDNIQFVNNSASERGGAIYSYGYVGIIGDNIQFVNNSASERGGAIIAITLDINASNIIFKNNNAWQGGAIFLSPLTEDEGKSDVIIIGDNIQFVNNTAIYGGSAIYNGAGSNITIENVVFSGNNASAIYIVWGNLNITGSVFEDNVGVNGSAIFNNGNLIVSGSNFTGNIASFAAAVYNNNTATLDDVCFRDNVALRGGAVVNMGTIIITNGNFTDNKGTMAAGALINNGTLTVKGTDFIDNNGAMAGGAIINLEGKTTLDDVTFSENSASISGGAVVNIAELEINNSIFKGNDAVQAGAIFNAGKLNVTGSRFIDNGVSICNKNINYSDDEFTIQKEGDAFIKESTFDKGEYILNNATLYLEANTLNSDGYFVFNDVDGVITSPVIMDLCIEDGSYASVNVGGTIYMYVSLTDDNNNPIYDINGIKITVNGKPIEDAPVYNESSNRFEFSFNSQVADTYEIKSEYENYYESITVEFKKTPVTITVGGGTVYDYNETFEFTITLNPAITGIVAVTVRGEDGEEYTFTCPVVDGEVDYSSLSDFVPGEYNIIVEYAGNEMYMASNTTFTLTVKQISTDLTVDVDDVVYGEDVTVTVNTNKGATGTVDITIGDEIYEDVLLVNGTASILVSGLSAGEYGIVVEYSGDLIYAPTVNTTSVVVGKAQSQVTVITNGGDVVYGDDVILNITSNVVGDVNIYIDDALYDTVLVDGEELVNVSVLDAGSHIVKVEYIGNNNYDSSESSVVFVVEKTVPSIGVNVSVIEDSVVISTVLEDDATGNITVTINDENYTYELVNGRQDIVISSLEPGDYEVYINYSGDDNYNPINLNVNITIEGTVELAADDLVLYYHDGSRFNVSLVDDGLPVVGVNVTFTINGVSYNRTTDGAGVAGLNINLNPGVYEITASYGNQSITCNVTVLSTISSDNLVKYFRNESQFYVSIVDGDGRPVGGVDVQFNINGVFYERTTGNDGVAVLNINLNPGEYIITVINPLNGEMASNLITVLPTVVVEDLVKYFRNESQLDIGLVDGQGNLLANTNVSININGVFYYRETNNEGIATLNINLNPGEYIATVQDLDTGLMMSALITVLPTMTADDLVMSFHDGSTYDVVVVDKQGNPVVGENVTMNINGVFYNRTTDDDGVARLNINLNPGEYIVTSYHDDAVISNKITVK